MQCKFVTHVTIADDADQAEEEQGIGVDQTVEEENAQQAVEEENAQQTGEEAIAYVEERCEEDSEGEVSDAEVIGSEQGSAYAHDIVDSDYDVSDLDDDLKEGTVEEPADVHSRAKPGPVQGSDEEELELPDSDDEAAARYKFTSFRKEDLHDPQFKTGRVF
ncbi:hypothetical protein ZWY2020_002856 [Hordeum vulgare]|nr:hypothetical protein ZWY2020_002856 [Hordeum vulgare]